MIISFFYLIHRPKFTDLQRLPRYLISVANPAHGNRIFCIPRSSTRDTQGEAKDTAKKNQAAAEKGVTERPKDKEVNTPWTCIVYHQLIKLSRLFSSVHLPEGFILCAHLSVFALSLCLIFMSSGQFLHCISNQLSLL